MKKLIFLRDIVLASCFLFAAAGFAAGTPETEPQKTENLLAKKHIWYRLSKTGKMQRTANSCMILELATPKSPWADAGYAKKITVNPGEKLVVAMEAKGAGIADYGIRMDKSGNITKAAKLTQEYQKFTAVFDFASLQDKLPQQGMLKIVLRGGSPDAKAEIRSFSFSVTKENK